MPAVYAAMSSVQVLAFEEMCLFIQHDSLAYYTIPIPPASILFAACFIQHLADLPLPVLHGTLTP